MPGKGLTGVIKLKNEPAQHWSKGLLDAMKHPDAIVEQDGLVVVINDKFPKANHHFLVLSKEEISGISKLNRTHLPLLVHMLGIADKVKDRFDAKFKIGFHAVPSMERLHMHVISDDFNSTCLKTKKHWNSYTTDFFIPAQDLIKDIETNGNITMMTNSMHKQLMSLPLKCHKCNISPKNMPALKDHIKLHL